METPREDLGILSFDGRDPLGILARQNASRIPELISLRMSRMAASPFAFYRGTAAIMAADHARDPHSALAVASCGDAHISNFGFFATPQRTQAFDLNDFDEAAWAPWEWDLKRLVTSVIIGGREYEHPEEIVREAAAEAVNAYVSTLRQSLSQTPLHRFFSHFDQTMVRENLDKRSRKVLVEAAEKARTRTSERVVSRLTEIGADGRRRFIENPPVMTHIDEETASYAAGGYEQYLKSCNVDIRMLLTSQFHWGDVIRRVVGVGSVGTRCYLVLLTDGRDGVLVLQVKQAGRSVLEEFGGYPQPEAYREIVGAHGEGDRVVSLQRILQAYSDPFLGHMRSPRGDFYVRQFHDMKGSVEIESLDANALIRYAIACGAVLARAHAQSRNAAAAADYIGKGKRIRSAILKWCYAYAELSLADYREFLASGMVPDNDATPPRTGASTSRKAKKG